jgi:hypothetical protein
LRILDDNEDKPTGFLMPMLKNQPNQRASSTVTMTNRPWHGDGPAILPDDIRQANRPGVEYGLSVPFMGGYKFVGLQIVSVEIRTLSENSFTFLITHRISKFYAGTES